VTDVPAELKELSTTMASIEAVLDLDKLRAEVGELEQQASAPNLWDDPENAQKVTSRLSVAQGDIRRVEDLRRRLDDAQVLWEMADDAGDDQEKAEAEAELTALRKSIDELEVRTLLSGPYDSREALVTIRSEAGGVDAADWAEMLLRMYLRWAEQQRFNTLITDRLEGEGAGIKSVTFEVNGENAYGLLQSEIGVHRLVRISPFDANARRHTSFASVFVYPQIDDEIKIDIQLDDLRIDTFRSGGAGGQHVNMTDSAVRITHFPTGIVVQCQNERSQTQNRETAMSMLRSKLAERAERERAEEIAREKGTPQDVNFGSQIRSYVLHPYKQVKDLRTGHEVGNVDAVLDGELDDFIRAELLRTAGSR